MDRFRNPVQTLLGRGALAALPELLTRLLAPDERALLLLWRETLRDEPPFQALQTHNGARLLVRTFPHANPTLEQLYALYEETRHARIGVVIAVGGGSVLDVGKSLCCLYAANPASPEALRTAMSTQAWGPLHCRWVGIPTTAGTGSEVTPWATIWDPTRGLKHSIATPENFAAAAIVDPALTDTMPTPLAVSSALDALAHATESWWANATNAVSRALACSAIDTLLAHLDGLFEPARATAARDAMAQGSLLAGLAFSNTRTTACHSISYPITLDYRVPHGVAVALLLGPVMRLNSRYRDLSALLKVYGQADAEGVQRRIHATLARASLATRLRDWGIPHEALDTLAQRGLTKGRADNNPAPLTPEGVRALLEEIY